MKSPAFLSADFTKANSPSCDPLSVAVPKNKDFCTPYIGEIETN